MPASDAPNPTAQPFAAEEPLPCPECPALIPPAQLEAHLRQAHKIYQFRGQRRPLQQTLAHLFNLVASPEPDSEAWTTTVDIVHEAYGPKADALLATSLGTALMRVADAERDACISALAHTIAASGCSPPLLSLLAAEPEPIARRLALSLAVRLPALIDSNLSSILRAVLSDQRLPVDATLEAAVVLAQRSGTDRQTRLEVYRALVAGLSKAQAVERLRALAEKIEPEPLLADFRTQLENQVRLACPRCSVQLRRAEMVAHLWNEHRLMLDGLRVREPWHAIEDWIDAYRLQNDAEALDRCRALAQHLDPYNGLQRVQRLCLAKGIEDTEARQAFLTEAAEQQASLCPHCFALVPATKEMPARPLNAWRGRVSAQGYRVEVRDTGLLSRLEIETPTAILYRGFEPPNRLTAKGALVLLAGPFVALALGVACGFFAPRLPPLVPVVLFLSAAGMMAVIVRWRWRRPRSASDRAVDYAWFRLVPRLHAETFSPAEASFLSGLAWTSLTRGRPSLRRTALERVVQLTEKAVAAGRAPVEHLADLHRLAIADAMKMDTDPEPLVVKQIGRCFDGKLPFRYVGLLLTEWQNGWWSHLNLPRLRILLCNRAFEAGFELSTLRDAGSAAPTLGSILDMIHNSANLACLRLLWEWRRSQPWNRCGAATTVFDLAARRESPRLLENYPDLLLVPEAGARGEEKAILLCARGIVFGNQLFIKAPQTTDVRRKRQAGEVVYEVAVDRERFEFRHDPHLLVERLNEWVRFHFTELLPQVADVAHRQSPTIAAALRTRETVPCPECSRAVLPHRSGGQGVRR